MNQISGETSSALLELQEEFEKLTRQKANSLKSTTAVRFERQFAKLFDKRKTLISKVPQFWLRALISHPSLGALITIDDCLRLQSLLDVDVLQMPQSSTSDFKVVFTFSPNEFFVNKYLTKSFQYKELAGLQVGKDEIQWKAGKDPRVAASSDPEDESEVYRKSFFDWFSEDKDNLHLGELIRDEIHPNAINLYFGSFVADHELFDDGDDDTETFASSEES